SLGEMALHAQQTRLERRRQVQRGECARGRHASLLHGCQVVEQFGSHTDGERRVEQARHGRSPPRSNRHYCRNSATPEVPSWPWRTKQSAGDRFVAAEHPPLPYNARPFSRSPPCIPIAPPAPSASTSAHPTPPSAGGDRA